jgi:hypothetical protein
MEPFHLYYVQTCESSNVGGRHSTEASDFVVLGRLCKSGLVHVAGKRWQLHCSSSLSSDTSYEVSPEGLWEVYFGYYLTRHQ